MSLSSLQLDAFLAVAKLLHFSQAAKQLNLTQSALSQRVQNLERELALTLFIRDRRGVRLTESGAELLRFCQTRESLESELRETLQTPDREDLAGMVRIGAYSSVLRSVVLPALGELLRAHPRVRVQCINREMRELPEVLRRAEADFIIMDNQLESSGLESLLLGEEEYLMTTSRDFPSPPEVYLDHDPEDTITVRFLRRQGAKPAKVSRSFLDEIYALIDGVALGLGRAVVPRHLVRADPRLKAVKGLKSFRVPVVLHYYAQPYYSRLHQVVVAELKAKAAGYLR